MENQLTELSIHCVLQEHPAGNQAIKKIFLGWRDGSAVKNPDYSSRGSEFNSQ
ncbi:rCG35628 [Rattus norvegicus]|uniref:RCG35628 n=1 Tax=Rattus norvegicus TaxID=10116 RepID=A6KF91_RAT|nr:rCG35628 [Rattus norvegicus]